MSSNPTPLVSIIVPCYNTARYVGEALDSALAQTYSQCEIVAIDDGSTDESAAILDRYAAQHPTRFTAIHQANQGLGRTRMNGIAVARGDFIVSLDADDRLHPDAVATWIAYQQAHPEFSVVYSFWQRIDADGTLTGVHDYRLYRPGEPLEGHILPTMLVSSVVAATSLIDKAALLAVGGYTSEALTRIAFQQIGNDRLRIEDYFLYLRLLLAGYAFGFVPQALFDYRDTPDSMSKNRRAMHMDQKVVLSALIDEHREAMMEGWFIGHQQREAHLGATWQANQDSIRVLNERIAQLEGELPAKDQALQESIAASQARVAQLEGNLLAKNQALQESIAASQAREAALADQLRQLTETIRERAAQLTELHLQFQAAQAEYAKMVAVAAVRELQLTDLHTQLEIAHTEYARLAASAAVSQAQLVDAQALAAAQSKVSHGFFRWRRP